MIWVVEHFNNRKWRFLKAFTDDGRALRYGAAVTEIFGRVRVVAYVPFDVIGEA